MAPAQLVTWVLLATCLGGLHVAAARSKPLRELLHSQTDTWTGTAIVISKDMLGEPDERLLTLRTDQGRHMHVLANTSQAAGILSGMRIQVTGRWRQARAVASSIDEAADDRSGGAAGGAEAAAGQPAGSFQVHAITAHWPDSRPMPLQSISAEPGNAVVAAATAGTVSPAAAATLSTNGLVAAELSVLVIPIVAATSDGQACPGTQLPSLSAEQVRRVVLEESNPGGATVGSTYRQCSHGKTRLTAANSLVADPVRLPCNGTSFGVPWTFSKCDFDDFNGWADAANEAVQRQLAAAGTSLGSYPYHFYLLPPSP